MTTGSHDLRYADHLDAPWPELTVSSDIDDRLDDSHLAVIAEQPHARTLAIINLDQRTFETLVTTYGRQFTAIKFWQCPLLADLSPLEDLPDLRLVSFYWSLARNPRLTGLQFDDFTRLHDLSDVAAGTSLTELSFGDQLWPCSVYESLEPLTALNGLRSLSFNPKRIEDRRVEPLAELPGLESLDFPTNMFTTCQVAWLNARLPASVNSRSLAPLVRFPRQPDADGKHQDVLLIGKGKPFLDSVADEARIRKYVISFERMVDEFRRNPTLKPD